MARRVASAVELPVGRFARTALASVSAWRHYAPGAAEPILARLYQQHHAQILWADDAVRDIWEALDGAELLTDFDAWRAEHPGFAGHWPTREHAERAQRTPAI